MGAGYTQNCWITWLPALCPLALPQEILFKETETSITLSVAFQCRLSRVC